MRPLIVLILILGAVAALVFAFIAVSDSPAQAADPLSPVVRPATPKPRSNQQATLKPGREVLTDPVARPTERVDVAEDNDEIQGGWPNQLLGTVLDEQGVPVQGATIRLAEEAETSTLAQITRLYPEDGQLKSRKKTVTDDQGRFRMKSIDPELGWVLVVDHPEYARVTEGTIHMPRQGDHEEHVTLRRGVILFGQVTDAGSGQPLQGALLTLDDPIAALLPGRRKNSKRMETTSDAQGYFEFRNLGNAQRVLTCTLQGYATQIHNNISFLGNDKQRLEMNCTLSPGQMIAGTVVGPDFDGIAGARVEAISHNNGVVSRGEGVSKAGGEFVIEGLGEGSYTLRAEVQGYDVDPLPRVDVGTTDVTIQCYEQGSVLGQVVDAETGRPLTEFTAFVRAAHAGSQAHGHVVTQKRQRGAKEGRFEVSGISEGAYVMQVNAEGYANSFSARFEVQQGLATPDVLVEMTKGSKLTCQLIDANTREPVVGAVLSTQDNKWIDTNFTRMFQNSAPPSLSRATGKSDENGEVELDLLTPGTYQLRVSHPNYTNVIMDDIRLVDGTTYAVGRLEMRSGSVVIGTVYGPDGSIARGVDVFLRAADGNFGRNKTARTDAHGRYEFKNAAEGEYKISAARPASVLQDNPFSAIVDMRNSESNIALVDGQELRHDLFLGTN